MPPPPNSTGLQAFLSESLGASYAPFVSQPILYYENPLVTSQKGGGPVEWIQEGSRREDDAPGRLTTSTESPTRLQN